MSYPYRSQYGPRSPTSPETAEIDESSPPLPPRPNTFTPQFSQPQFSQPQFSQPQGSQAPQFPQPPVPPTPSSYTPYERGNPYQEPTATSPRHFSWRSAFGQVAQSFTNGGPMASPPAPSFPSSVMVNGVELGQADLLTLRGLLGTVIPGNYWYDRRSGGYGSAGGPCTGFLVAGLPLGNGELHPHASGNTGTGVFINGREIHTMDVVGLQAMGVWVRQGRWWLNADGSYGMEGSPIPLGNLRMQATARPGAGGGWGGGGANGGSHTWSTRMGHYGGSDGQGFSYIGGPGWTYYSG
ncbi:hypothetical protein EDB80DRAFT_777559 [Ilyonectria destructans]|nr:hypothetical protein EDB80DRAFT_777559 [Ilyonectria destructans]